jgi:stress response protein YsnF
MKVQLSYEEIDAIKESYAEEEVMMKKKLDIETRAAERPATSEKFGTSIIKEGKR